MTKIKFMGATAIASNHEALTVGAVGLGVQFEFNSAWDGLNKTAVFHCGGVTKDVLGSSFPANICPIPWECLQEEGETLYCGVYGTDSNGKVIIPSKMARLGTVHPGADPTGDESLDPTLPVWQQALNIAQDAMSQLAGKVNRSGDTMQGDLDIGTHTLRLGSTTGMTEDNLNIIRLVADRVEDGVTLRNIDTPYEDSDAVNKKYVDDTVTEVLDKLSKTTGTFRINVTSSNGVYSADKTFDEIKAAYDAGKQPYVVYGGDAIYTLSSCYFASEQMYMAFERYLIGEDTLKTETLRICSYTLANGSNIEQRISAFNVPNGTTYVKVNSTGGVISTVNGETYADIQALINAGKLVVVRYDDALDFYYFETFRFSDSSGTHKRLNFRCVMDGIVYTLTLRDDNTWAFSETSLQSESITDTGGYFTTDTVEGALQEIGAEIQKRVPRVFYFENDTTTNTTQFMTAEDSAALKAALVDHTPVMLIAKTQGEQYCYLPVNCSPVPTSDNINDPNTEFSYTFQTVNNVYRAYVSCSGSGTPSIAVFQTIS